MKANVIFHNSILGGMSDYLVVNQDNIVRYDGTYTTCTQYCKAAETFWFYAPRERYQYNMQTNKDRAVIDLQAGTMMSIPTLIAANSPQINPDSWGGTLEAIDRALSASYQRDEERYPDDLPTDELERYMPPTEKADRDEDYPLTPDQCIHIPRLENANAIFYNRGLNNFVVVTEGNHPVADGSLSAMVQFCNELGYPWFTAPLENYHYSLSKRKAYRYNSKVPCYGEQEIDIASWIHAEHVRHLTDTNEAYANLVRDSITMDEFDAYMKEFIKKEEGGS